MQIKSGSYRRLIRNMRKTEHDSNRVMVLITEGCHSEYQVYGVFSVPKSDDVQVKLSAARDKRTKLWEEWEDGECPSNELTDYLPKSWRKIDIQEFNA